MRKADFGGLFFPPQLFISTMSVFKHTLQNKQEDLGQESRNLWA